MSNDAQTALEQIPIAQTSFKVACQIPSSHAHYHMCCALQDGLLFFGGTLEFPIFFSNHHTSVQKDTYCDAKHVVHPLMKYRYVYSAPLGKNHNDFIAWGGYDTTYQSNIYRVSLSSVELITQKNGIVSRAGAAFCGTWNKQNEFVLIMFGGYDGRNFLQDVQEFNLETQTWRKLQTSNTPSKRSAMASAYHSNRNSLFCHGGYDSQVLGDLFELDLQTLSWTKHPSCNMPQYAHRMCIAQEKIYLHLRNTLLQYDPQGMVWQRVNVLGFELAISQIENTMTYDRHSNQIVLYGGEKDLHNATIWCIELPAKKSQWNANLKGKTHFSDILVLFE